MGPPAPTAGPMEAGLGGLSIVPGASRVREAVDPFPSRDGAFAADLRAALTEEFLKRRPIAEAAQLTAGALLGYAMWPHAGWPALAWWIGLVGAVRLARRERARSAGREPAGRLGAARLGVAATACAWSAGLLLLVPGADPATRNTALLVVAGVWAVLPSTAAADRWSQRTLSAALLGSLLLPMLSGATRSDAVTMVAVAAFGLVMERLGADAHARLRESLRDRLLLVRQHRESDLERRELTRLFERAPWGFAVVDRHGGRFRRVSRAFAELTGLSAQELAGTSLEAVLPGTSVEPGARELSIGRPDGSSVWLRVASEEIAGETGPARLLLCEDVTARHLQEEAEGRYRELVETASDMIWRTDAEGRWSFLNAAASRVYGVPAAELLGQPALDRVAPDQVGPARAAFQAVLAGEEVRDRETVHLHSSGAPRYLSLSAWPERDAAGRIVGAQGIARDVTERVAAREAVADLARERALLASLIDASPDLVFIKDGDGRYQWANAAFAAYLGRPGRDISGKTDVDLLGAERGEPLRRSDREVLLTARPARFEGWLEYADGRRVLAETVLTPARAESGEVVGLIGISRDVTQRRRAEDELKRLAERAEHATRMKSQFLALMSHEIRTPLNGVVGMLELLLDSPLPEEQRHQAGAALSSAEALLTLLGDILDFSRIEAGRLAVESVPFDLPALLSGLVELMTPLVEERGNRIRLVVDPSLPRTLEGDPGRIRQVLTNLLGNAARFTDRGEIRLTARRAGPSPAGGIVLTVQDTGMGIPADRMRAIFEPFTQADSSITRRFGGSGLGLAISRQLVQLMSGQLTGHSVVGAGSVFTVWLPLREPAPEPLVGDAPVEAAAPRRDAVANPASSPIGPLERPLSVLVVEDSLVNQRVARLMLEKRGHTVEVACNGREALETIAARPFDVVLMDLQMPELDGLAATTQLRARGFDALPVVALTAHAYAEERGRCAAVGMDDFLPKPFKMHQLIVTVERWGHGRFLPAPRVDSRTGAPRRMRGGASPGSSSDLP